MLILLVSSSIGLFETSVLNLYRIAEVTKKDYIKQYMTTFSSSASTKEDHFC